jgi:Glycosyl hydrolases family 18
VIVLKTILRPPWRTIFSGVLLLALFFGSYTVWQPGRDIRDGRHDLGRNGIWLGHGWLGADKWFLDNGRTNQIAKLRGLAQIHGLAEKLRRYHIKDVFPHLCPSDPYGNLPAMDDTQAEQLLAEFQDFRVMPWIGGPAGPSTRFSNVKWRETFIRSITNMLAAHPRFAGVQINIEPLTSGDKDFLNLLDQIHAALPKGKLLSVAAYPPPTRWQPSADVHWDENYFREVARRSDQLAVMMYDTGTRVPKIYEHILANWTSETLSWSEGKPVLLGIPTYDDAGVEYHNPKVENLRTALLGVHKGLAVSVLPPSYQGVALYCEWETDADEWNYFQAHFLKN